MLMMLLHQRRRPALHGLPTSAQIEIPANGVVVLAKA
jgi:hypothetical protein